MQDDMVLVSCRIPRRMSEALAQHAKERHYASTSEAIRDAIRKHLVGNAIKATEAMKGALKGKVKLPKGGMRTVRKRMWEDALKRAGGNKLKAFEIMDANGDKLLAKSGLKL